MMRRQGLSADNATRTMTRMISEGSPGTVAGTVAAWLPPLLLAAVSALLQAAGANVNEALRYERVAVEGGEWWRLVTANLVHLGWWHWFLNALSLGLLVLLCPEPARPSEWLVRVLTIGAGMSLGLHLLVPALGIYVGLSGLVYGLFALGFGRQIAAGDRFAIACLAFLAARIVWELVWGAPQSEQDLIGGAVVAESHLTGVIAAALYGVATGAFRRPRRLPAP